MLDSSGDEVRRLQDMLKFRYRSYAGDLIVDGAFGERTQEIVREFQRRSHLVPDGVVGSATRRALGLAS
ncbi:MAG: peptidoglycan-binding domain-containing protein [Pseudonocardiales bacterium]